MLAKVQEVSFLEESGVEAGGAAGDKTTLSGIAEINSSGSAGSNSARSRLVEDDSILKDVAEVGGAK